MDKKFLALTSVFFIAFILFLSLVAFNGPIRRFTSAREDVAPSANASVIFGWPLETTVGQPVKIDVFVRSATGRPLSGKIVTVTASAGTITQVAPKTDDNGKATFTLVSQQTGVSEVSATIDSSTAIAKKLTVKFTE